MPGPASPGGVGAAGLGRTGAGGGICVVERIRPRAADGQGVASRCPRPPDGSPDAEVDDRPVVLKFGRARGQRGRVTCRVISKGADVDWSEGEAVRDDGVWWWAVGVEVRRPGCLAPRLAPDWHCRQSLHS